jgi:hypothetical protein
MLDDWASELANLGSDKGRERGEMYCSSAARNTNSQSQEITLASNKIQTRPMRLQNEM